MSDEVEKESEPKDGKDSRPGPWLRLLVTGLAAVAIQATAAPGGGHATDAPTANPAVCVVLKATP
jgi:hypothetical protein